MGSAPTDVDRLFAEAARLHRAGDRGRASALLDRVLALDPGHADAAIELARNAAAEGKASDAVGILRRAFVLRPDHFALGTSLGVLLAQIGCADQAIDVLQQVETLQPALAVGAFNLANALKSSGRLAEAAVKYRAAIARDPRFAAAHSNLGNTLALLGRVDDAAEAHDRATALRRGPSALIAETDPLSRKTSEGKLRHDIEQLEHLSARGKDVSNVLSLYRAVLRDLPAPAPGKHMVELPVQARAALASTYNRLWHRIAAPRLAEGALNPKLDARAIEADYALNTPGITHVDDLLRPEALESLRRFCLESTIWFQFTYANGYLGAFWEQGFWCPLLAQIQEELRLALPAIFGEHLLRKLWAFKYDSRLSGIPMHADFAR